MKRIPNQPIVLITIILYRDPRIAYLDRHEGGDVVCVIMLAMKSPVCLGESPGDEHLLSTLFSFHVNPGAHLYSLNNTNVTCVGRRTRTTCSTPEFSNLRSSDQACSKVGTRSSLSWDHDWTLVWDHDWPAWGGLIVAMLTRTSNAEKDAGMSERGVKR